MSPIDVDRYLDRIGFDTPIAVDHTTLAGLQYAHLSTVPFENLDVFVGRPVATSLEHSVAKIVDRGRGGWCFELNGAFGGLLEALGFDVRRLGAAVQLGGPTDVVDHLVLEVTLDQPYLVEVGFGAEAPIEPLPLNRTGPLSGGGGARFELFESPKGTTLAGLDEGAPKALYRFSRVARTLADFAGASERLQADKALSWHQAPFATRLIGPDGDRLTLRGSHLRRHRVDGTVEPTPINPTEWNATLHKWFGIDEPLGPDVVGAD